MTVNLFDSVLLIVTSGVTVKALLRFLTLVRLAITSGSRLRPDSTSSINLPMLAARRVSSLVDGELAVDQDRIKRPAVRRR